MWATLSSGLGAGGVGLLIDIVFTNGVLGIMEFRVTKWFFIIGLCIGALMDITSYIKDKNESSKIERLKHYSAPMKNTEVYSRLISYDRQNILSDIRKEAEKNTTKDNTPRIDIGSTIPHYKDALNKLLSDWRFKDLSDDEYVQLKLAIAFTEGYRLISSENYYEFGVDDKYWQKYIDSEIARCRKIALDEYAIDQSGKKSIYGSSQKATIQPTRKTTSSTKANTSTNRPANRPISTIKQNQPSTKSGPIEMAVKAFENAYETISKNKNIFGFTSIIITGGSRISFTYTGEKINDKNINLLRPSGFKAKNINGVYYFSFEIPYSAHLEQETMRALKEKHSNWSFSSSGVMVN